MTHSSKLAPIMIIKQRIGVYGIVKEGKNILFITQISGPFAGLLDLPGGGIELGETPLEALHREFREEIGMDFCNASPLGNYSTVTETVHRIGLFYMIEGLQSSPEDLGTFVYKWIDPESLNKNDVSPMAWQAISSLK
jgi:mutator protein MutT